MSVQLKWFDDQLKLKYPCQWIYKVIGRDARLLREAVAEVIPTVPYLIRFSNFSNQGNYICLNVELTLDNENQRNRIFQQLKRQLSIAMVL